MDAVASIIHASAPTRICDNGGWTDTWFAQHGSVFSIAVEPRVMVEVCAVPANPSRPPVIIDARSFGDRYAPDGIAEGRWGKHPLLEAAIAEVGLPPGMSITVVIGSQAPFGASIGTSAATCVALIGAIDALTPGRRSPHEVARAAWRVETERLGQQSGVQDQLAAAHGGINLIEIAAYPEAVVTPVDADDSVLRELERRLLVFYLGAPHESSAIHRAVIAELAGAGRDAPALDELRRTAHASANALRAGDLDALGAAMTTNTEAQRRLHHDLISPEADRLITAALANGAVGYKVNGAGGTGGTVTVLASDDDDRIARTTDAVLACGGGLSLLPVRLAADGLRVQVDDAPSTAP